MAPDVLKLGKPVMIGGTDPALTHMGNQWLFRFRPNDSYSGRVIADYGVKTLGKKKWAIVHSTDAFGTAGGKALAAALDKTRQRRRCSTRAMPTRARISRRSCWRSKRPAPTCSAPISPSKTISASSPASCASSASTFPGSARPRWSAVAVAKLAGPALFGTYGVADYAEDSSEASKEFGKAYRDAYKSRPDNQSSWTYDAVTVLSAAINKAGSTDPAKIREAMLATKKATGAEGEYNFDANRRRPARLQHRAQREGHDRLRQAHRLQRLSALAGPSTGGPARFRCFAKSIAGDVGRLVDAMPASARLRLLPPGVAMDLVLQLLFTGIGIGAVYALVALGFVLIFRATNVVNFAQGEFSMVAAYLMVVFAVDLGWPYWLSFLIALAGMALLGRDLQSRRLLSAAPPQLSAGRSSPPSAPRSCSPIPCSRSTARSRRCCEGWFDTPGIQLGPVYLDSQYLLIIAVTLVLVIFNIGCSSAPCSARSCRRPRRTRRWPRCSAFPSSAMIMITFVYTAVLGGLAGILVAPVLFVSIQMGSTIALKAFAATIIGGFGDVAGAIIGGFALGIIETFGAAYISVPFKDAFAFLVLVLFLVFRPQGIFGERVAEKA